MNHINRCKWCGDDPLYVNYHDVEWGVPVHDEQKLFECLMLETFQTGLSWITILRKRESFRSAFDDFDFQKIGQYREDKINDILQDPGIVRNKLKVRAAVSNARAFIEVQKEYGSFDNYLWAFVDNKPILNSWQRQQEMPMASKISERLRKDLKQRGFKFVGPKVVYAFMQAIGMVNDHQKDCFRYTELAN
mgnify:CR=1 FL=1